MWGQTLPPTAHERSVQRMVPTGSFRYCVSRNMNVGQDNFSYSPCEGGSEDGPYRQFPLLCEQKYECGSRQFFLQPMRGRLRGLVSCTQCLIDLNRVCCECNVIVCVA
jgi:hypothetical protein